MKKLLFLILPVILFAGCATSEQNYGGSSSLDTTEYEDEFAEESVELDWTMTTDACNQNTGSCYTLDVETDGENVTRVNFPNGGYRDVDYSDCSEGYCYITDEDGTEWEISY